MKYLIVIIVIAVVLWLMFGVRRRARTSTGTTQARPQPANPPGPADTMVACAHCGVLLPRGEGLPAAGGRVYCSAEHRDAGPGTP